MPAHSLPIPYMPDLHLCITAVHLHCIQSQLQSFLSLHCNPSAPAAAYPALYLYSAPCHSPTACMPPVPQPGLTSFSAYKSYASSFLHYDFIRCFKALSSVQRIAPFSLVQFTCKISFITSSIPGFNADKWCIFLWRRPDAE